MNISFEQNSRRFYSLLIQGAPRAHALAEAKRALRTQPATRHPNYWAGVILRPELGCSPATGVCQTTLWGLQGTPAVTRPGRDISREGEPWQGDIGS